MSVTSTSLPNIPDPGVQDKVAVVPEHEAFNPLGGFTGGHVTEEKFAFALSLPAAFTAVTCKSLYSLPGSLSGLYDVPVDFCGTPIDV